MSIKVSIIVPCYNIAPFVSQCMECLTRQTLRDIEIICIDDRSTDATPGLLREYAQTDPRITVITQKRNGGVSDARNAGMAAARGQYIGFVDPDDLVDANFFETLYNLAVAGDADIAKGAVKVVSPDGGMEIINLNPQIRTSKFNFSASFWSAIYRREMLQKNGVEFPREFIISEDLIFLMKAVHFARTIATTDDVYYWYYRRENSADSQDMSTPKIDSGIGATRHMIEWTDAQPDATDAERLAAARKAYCNAAYLAGKNLRPLDIQKILDLLMWWYDAASAHADAVPDLRPRVRRAMRRKNEHALRSQMFVKNTRLRLFGVIPLMKRSRILGWGTRYLLFEFMPVLTVRPGMPKTKIYSFGIPVVSIKR